MNASATWVRLDRTTPATEIAPHSPPTWETLADGGQGQCSFQLARSPKFEPDLLRPGTVLEALVGCERVWYGRVDDYDRESGEVVGRGMQVDATQIPALDGSGNSTRNLATALTTAIAAPWSWPSVNPNDVAGIAVGDSTDVQMLSSLLDEVAQQQGVRWRQRASGALMLVADPTTPQWIIAADVATLGPTNEGRATRLVGRYDTGAGNATTIRTDPDEQGNAVAETVDLTDRGVLTLAEANGILDEMLDATRSGVGWVNGITVSRDQLLTLGGTPAALPSVVAGQMVRLHSVTASALLPATWLDVVIGKTTYTAGDDVIHLEPANTAPRTARAVWAA